MEILGLAIPRPIFIRVPDGGFALNPAETAPETRSDGNRAEGAQRDGDRAVSMHRRKLLLRSEWWFERSSDGVGQRTCGVGREESPR
jgi:hypothetical protein